MTKESLSKNTMLSLILLATIVLLADALSFTDNWRLCRSKKDGTVLPIRSDCKSYIYCLYQLPIEIKCPFAEGFSAREGHCVRHSKSDCVAPAAVASTKAVDVTTPTAFTDCIAPPAMNADICASRPDGHLLRYPYDCNAYIKCINSCPEMQYCKENTVFNPMLKICDTPEVVQCEPLPTPPVITTEATVSTTNNDDNETKTTTKATTTTTEEISTTTEDESSTTAEETSTTTESSTTTVDDSTTTAEETSTTTESSTTTVAEESSTSTESSSTTVDESSTIAEETSTTTESSTTIDDESSTTAEETSTTTDSSTTIQDGSTTTEEETSTTTESSTTTVDESSTTAEQTSTTTEGLSTPVDESSTTTEETSTESSTTTVDDSTTTADETSTTDEGSTTTVDGSSTTEEETSTKTEGSTTAVNDSTTTEEVTSTTAEGSTTTVDDSSTTEEETSTTTESLTTTVDESSTTAEQTSTTTESSTTTVDESSTTAQDTTASTETSTTTSEETSTTTETSTTITEDTTTAVTISTPSDSTSTSRPCHPLYGIDPNICTDKNPGTMLPYPYKCTAYILCESSSCARLQYCSDDKFFNAYLGICDTAGTAGCVEEQYPTPGTPTEQTTPSDNDKTTALTSTTTEATTTTLLPIEIDPFICQDLPDGALPYEADCTKYLLCTEGNVSLWSCPLGWLFNADRLICDQATEDVCYSSIKTTESNASSVTKLPINAHCVNKKSGTTVALTNDCQRYINCLDDNDGSYLVLQCDNNNYFDPQTGVCNSEASANACQLAASSTTIATTTSVRKSTKTLNEQCSEKPIGSTIAYVEDCSKYVYCSGFDAFIISCPGKYYYSVQTGRCVRNADPNACRDGNEQTGSTTTQTPTTTTQASSTTTAISTTTSLPAATHCAIFGGIGSLIEYSGYCQKYISCIHPVPIGFYCSDNYYFHAEQQQCIPGLCEGMQAVQPTPSSICQGSTALNAEAYTKDCQLYYQCLGNNGYMLKACRQGEYFNPLSGQCSAEVGSQYCKQDLSTTTAAPTTVTVSTSTTTPKPLNGICTGVPDGAKVTHPYSCEKYIVCQTPIPEAYDCGHGLQFNSSLQTCVIASEADCGIA